tara:strand:+ start:453 stop:590 length:138 start_codon:yes stop_codon:yes gene_type:complete
MENVIDLILVGLFLQTLTMIAVFVNTGINIVYRLKEKKELCKCQK